MAWPNFSFELTAEDLARLNGTGTPTPAPTPAPVVSGATAGATTAVPAPLPAGVRASRVINQAAPAPATEVSRFVPAPTTAPAPAPSSAPGITGGAVDSINNTVSRFQGALTIPPPVPTPTQIDTTSTATTAPGGVRPDRILSQTAPAPATEVSRFAPAPATPTTPPAPVMAPPPEPVKTAEPAVTKPAMPTPVEAAPAGPTVSAPTTGAPAGGIDVAPPSNPIISPSLPPDDPFRGAMEDFFAQAKNWMSGTSDPAIRTAMNRALDQVGLHNQAAMDALKMQINQDPTLRGQGAGLAMLNSMARDQNFKVDDIIANMSEKNLERMVNMQKYGFEAGMKIEGLQFERRQELADNLIESGDYSGAAAILQQNAENIAPGMGLHISAESLKNRDPFEINRVSNMLSLVKDLAKTDPAAATSLLNSMIAGNPTLKSWLPEGITAEQMITSIASGQTAANAGAADTVRTSIREDIANGGDYGMVSSRMVDLFKLQGRDATKEGSTLTLERINEIREGEGLPPILDKAELDEIDFEELGYKNQFYADQAKANEAPWQSTYDAIMKSSDAVKFLDPALFVNGTDALKDFLINQSLGIDEYDFDPATGTLVPTASSTVTVPWEDPKRFSMFYHMPLATFDADGKVIGTDFSLGGSAFSTASPKNENDTALQPKYAAYLSEMASKGTQGTVPLSAPEWYFATAGGTKPVNATNIPSSVTAGTPSDLNSVTNLGADYDPIKFKSDFNLMTPTAAATQLKDPAFLQHAIDSGSIPVLNNPSVLATTDFSDIQKNSLGYAVINGKPVQIGKSGTTSPPDSATTLPGIAGALGPTPVSLKYVSFVKDGKTYWLITDSKSPKYPAGMIGQGDPSSAPINVSPTNIGNYNG